MLPIQPVPQDTPVWCWLAVGEMIFKHRGIRNVNPVGVYQCGIIGALTGPQSPCFYDCRVCTVPAGSPQAVVEMLRRYPEVVRMLTGDVGSRLNYSYKPYALSRDEIRRAIDDDRPVITGISPGGSHGLSSSHVALVVGYQERGNLDLIVNDPFPYSIVAVPNPYLVAGGVPQEPGRYVIGYDLFRQRLAWTESFVDQ